MKFFKRIIFFTVFSLSSVVSPTLVLDQPITYVLGNNLIDPGNDIVQITSNNVIFDLNENSLAGGINGIVINPGLSNITIRNGNIAQVIGSGIVVGQGCTNIEIDNLRINQCAVNALQFDTDCRSVLFSRTLMTMIGQTAVVVPERCSGLRFLNVLAGNCGGNAFSFLGTSSADPVEDILINSVITTTCCVLPTFSHVIRIAYGENVVISDVTINNGGNPFNDVSLVEFNASSGCSLSNIVAIGNCGGSLTGLNLVATSSSIFQNVTFFNNCAINADFVGFSLTETSRTNFFSFCSVFTCSSSTGDAIGFHVASGSNSPLFRNCNVAGLVADNNVIGFNFFSDSDPLRFIILDNCGIARSLALTGTAIGIEINGADFGTIKDTASSYSRAPLGLAAGLRFSTLYSGERWNISGSNFVRNIALSDADSYGILVEDSNAGDNLFIQNFAFDNGDTAGNQMFGVPAGSVTQLTPNNLNSADTPWGNIVVTV